MVGEERREVGGAQRFDDMGMDGAAEAEREVSGDGGVEKGAQRIGGVEGHAIERHIWRQLLL